jgi:hypothetical protein
MPQSYQQQQIAFLAFTPAIDISVLTQLSTAYMLLVEWLEKTHDVQAHKKLGNPSSRCQDAGT